MHFLNRKHKISWFRRSPNGPRICSNCVPGASPGALEAPWDPRSVSEPGLGCPHGLRGPLWEPNLASKICCFRYPPVNFRRKTNLKPFALRCFDFQCRWCEESFVGFPVIWLTSPLFFFGVGGSGRSPLESADPERGPACGAV